MWSIVVTIERPVNRLSFPVIAISIRQFEREPNVDKAAVAQKDTQLVETWDKRIYHNISVLDRSNMAEVVTIYQDHATVPSRSKRRSRSNSR